MLIAIVEDTPVNLVVMQSMVKKLGDHDCQVFSEPELGLAWCLENEPDLIVVDYMMPRMNGLEFIRSYRSAVKRETPVLMVTAAAEREVRYAALEAGATDFLTKPIDKHEFSPRVRNMLKLRASMQVTEDRAEELAGKVRKATLEIHSREQETIMRLAKAAEFRDPETGAHILRMANYSALIGRQLGMDADQLDCLLSASPMHDVGKVGTPDNILLKPGRLSPEEMVIMRQHSLIGYEILKDSTSPMLQMAADIALNHHEKYDGSGYPYGKSGEEIPLVGRIVSVADVFDALTSERPYKKSWDLESSRAYLIAGRGKQFDPICVEAFLSQWAQVMAIRQDYAD
jgi:response regulator RpfG family c-di-GMP phosphodiesterase